MWIRLRYLTLYGRFSLDVVGTEIDVQYFKVHQCYTLVITEVVTKLYGSWEPEPNEANQ